MLVNSLVPFWLYYVFYSMHLKKAGEWMYFRYNTYGSALTSIYVLTRIKL